MDEILHHSNRANIDSGGPGVFGRLASALQRVARVVQDFVHPPTQDGVLGGKVCVVCAFVI